MSAGRGHGRRLLAAAVLAGAIAGTSVPANAATAATFANGILTVNGDGADNTITLSRDAAGQILVNNGAIAVVGDTPTVADTSLTQAFGAAGNDTISLDEANGALPAANLFGGRGTGALTGGTDNDTLTAATPTTRSSARV